jgi:hypothetical protein
MRGAGPYDEATRQGPSGAAVLALLASPPFMAAVSVSLLALEEHGCFAASPYGPFILWGNAAIAAFGSAAGVAFMPMSRLARVAFGIAAVPVAVVVYVMLFLFGALVFLDLGL